MKQFLILSMIFGFLLVWGNRQEEYYVSTESCYDYEWHLEKFDTVSGLLNRLDTLKPSFVIGIWDEKTLEKIEVEMKFESRTWYEIKKRGRMNRH